MLLKGRLFRESWRPDPEHPRSGTDRSVNKWLNERLKRTEFMPFAPVVLWEECDRCFRNVDGGAETARFMTMTFDWFISSLPCDSWTGAARQQRADASEQTTPAGCFAQPSCG